jgi:protein-S-isoprenylcysteine O-methyltransferase Ste14
MVLASLVIYGVWLLVALVLRAAVQYARTGDHGFRLHADRPFTGAWFARLGFVLALLVGGLSPALVLADALGPIAALDRWPLQGLGVGLAVGGVAATFVAQLAMGRSWRVGVDEDERTELVRRWPFTIVRNPIFTTMGCTAVGLALMVPTALALLGLAMLGWSLEHQVRHVEEPYLRAVHGTDYERYLAEVGRFLPRLGRRRETVQS